MKTFEHYELKYTFSNESIMGYIKDLYAGKKPEIDKKNIKEVNKQLSDTYANINWVKKRGVVDKEVYVEEGSLLIDDAIGTKISELKNAINNNKTVITSWLNKNKVIIDCFNKIMAGSVNDQDLIKVGKIKFQRLSSGLKLTPLYSQGVKKIHSLSEKEVADTAKLIEDLTENLLKEIFEITTNLNQYTDIELKDLNKELNKSKVDTKSKEISAGINVIKTFISEINNYYGDSKDVVAIDELIADHRLQLYHLVLALVDWMEKSVK